MAPLGIVTGSGTYALPDFDDARVVEVATRFGPVSVTQGTFGGREVAHVSRHEPEHRRLSSAVRHQANVSALREVGCVGVLGATVCGAVDLEVELGSLVVFDDLHFLANRLPDGAICTLYDEPGMAGRGHWVYEDPYSPPLRAALLAAAGEVGAAARDGGCYGHVDGPRFNTKAEIRSLAQVGVTAVSQTAGPETVLCGEAELPYALVGFATDYANGVAPEPTPVEVLGELIGRSSGVLASVLARAAASVDDTALAPVGTHFRFG